MKCYHDDGITCLEDCELIENCPDRERMLEVRESLMDRIIECAMWYLWIKMIEVDQQDMEKYIRKMVDIE